MDTLAVTYRHIAYILSFETSNPELEVLLKTPSFNWDAIVVEGSKHLLLPAIYCRLKAKKLLHVLPKELAIYLEDITEINRNRNLALQNQINFIAELFKEHNINHVFIKGAALLALEPYEDNAERMVGDIDILVSKNQLLTAFNLLKHNGYTKTFGFAYQTIGFRHLDRLISPNELAAIELHDELLIKKYRNLINIKEVLISKRYINSIPIPSTYYLSKHQILARQLNDKGHFYNSVNLKTLYDSLVLNVYTNDILLIDLLKLKFGQSYLALAKYYFTEFTRVSSNKYLESYTIIHLKYITNPVYKSVLKPIKHHYTNFISRLKLAIYNRFYRLHVLKKIFISKK